MKNKFDSKQNSSSKSCFEASDGILITTDKNLDLGYENKKWLYFLMAPIMWILTLWVAIKKKILGSNLKVNTFWVDGLSAICREIKETATTWRALDIVYNYEFEKRKGFKGKITDFWLKILNAQALRNRFKLVKQKLKEEIEIISQKESEIRLFSIASGSAQAVVEVMAELKEKNIKAIFLDLDPMAIEHSKKLAQKAGVIDQITFINKGANVLEEAIKKFNPHIIELVGFLEYRPEEKAIKLIERIYRVLAPKGTLLVSNIYNNPESLFLHYVVNWSMIYRSPKKLAEIIVKGGFNPQNCQIVFEPLKIHYIAECKKL